MKMRWLTPILGMTLAVLLTLVVAPGLVFGDDRDDNKGWKHGRGLEGTWFNDVKLVLCSNPAMVIATFQSMTTYMRGGILIEGGGPATPPPAVSRSAGHGIWERTGRHTFRVFFRIHSFDNLGRLVRIVEVTNHLSLIKGDNPDTPDAEEPYYLSGEGTSQITNRNPDTGALSDPIEGCNEATSRPVLFED